MKFWVTHARPTMWERSGLFSPLSPPAPHHACDTQATGQPIATASAAPNGSTTAAARAAPCSRTAPFDLALLEKAAMKPPLHLVHTPLLFDPTQAVFHVPIPEDVLALAREDTPTTDTPHGLEDLRAQFSDQEGDLGRLGEGMPIFIALRDLLANHSAIGHSQSVPKTLQKVCPGNPCKCWASGVTPACS